MNDETSEGGRTLYAADCVSTKSTILVHAWRRFGDGAELHVVAVAFDRTSALPDADIIVMSTMVRSPVGSNAGTATVLSSIDGYSHPVPAIGGVAGQQLAARPNATPPTGPLHRAMSGEFKRSDARESSSCSRH